MPTHPWLLWGYRHVAPKTPIGVPQHRRHDHMIAGYVANIAALISSHHQLSTGR